MTTSIQTEHYKRRFLTTTIPSFPTIIMHLLLFEKDTEETVLGLFEPSIPLSDKSLNSTISLLGESALLMLTIHEG